MNENTTLINEATEVVANSEVTEAAVDAVANAAGKAVANVNITKADKIMACGIFGLAIVGAGALGYGAYKGGKKLYKVIKTKVAAAKAAKVEDEEVIEVLDDDVVEVVEEPKKKAKATK